MATVTDVLTVARQQLGYVEVPVNRTKYGAWYGLDGNPWCAMSLSWIFDKCGMGDQYRHAAVIQSLNRAGREGRRTSTFRVGQVACVMFTATAGHTGLVEAVHSDGTVTTLEGNTSAGAAGSQRNGGGFYRRRRSVSFWNRGCIVINYGASSGWTPPPTTPGSTPTTAPSGQLAVDGELGPQTYRKLQESLNSTGANPRLSVDGEFGPMTKRALQARLNHVQGPVAVDGGIGPQTIRALQRHVGSAADGQWGPNTTSALQRKLNSGNF